MSARKASLILGTVVLVAGVLAFMSQAVASPPGGHSTRVTCKTITLDAGGDDRTLVFDARSDVIIQEIWVDNTPTYWDGLCELVDDGEDGPVTCKDADYRIVKVSIMGSDFRPGNLPKCVAKQDSLSIRTLLDQDFETGTAWPVNSKETVKLTLDADAEGCQENFYNNDRKIRLCFGYHGKRNAWLYVDD